MHAAGARLAFEHEHARHHRQDLAVQLLRAEIHRLRERAFHHVDVTAHLVHVDRLGGGRGAGGGRLGDGN